VKPSAGEIRKPLHTYVQESFLYMRPELKFDDHESLLKRGILDSLGVAEKAGFVEEKWKRLPSTRRTSPR
jgi:hypothetical protein